MSEVIILGIDLAKRVFHLHGARVDGNRSVVLAVTHKFGVAN